MSARSPISPTGVCGSIARTGYQSPRGGRERTATDGNGHVHGHVHAHERLYPLSLKGRGQGEGRYFVNVLVAVPEHPSCQRAISRPRCHVGCRARGLLQRQTSLGGQRRFRCPTLSPQVPRTPLPRRCLPALRFWMLKGLTYTESPSSSRPSGVARPSARPSSTCWEPAGSSTIGGGTVPRSTRPHRTDAHAAECDNGCDKRVAEVMVVLSRP